MSDIVPASPAQPPALTREQVAGFIDEPLRQLPAALRVPVWEAWSGFSALTGMASQLPLATRVRWAVEEGSTAAEVLDVLSWLKRRCEEYQFGAEVLRALSGELRRRRHRRRRDEANARARAAAGTTVGRLITDIGRKAE